MKIETVLAAVAQPGDGAQPVIERAGSIAQATGAQIVLFHAAFDAALSGGSLLSAKRLARLRGDLVDKRTRELDRHARALRKRGLEVSMHVVWEEPAYESIIRAAIRESADLVVAGPHAAARRNTPSMRQNDWQLLRLCPRPLLLVRKWRRAEGPVLAALDPMHANDKPANLDRTLLDAASALAAAIQTEVQAVHSISPMVYALDEHTPAARARMREKVHTRMQRVLRRARLAAARIHILQGAPEETIPELARKLDAQLLVMGAVSRRGLARFAIGDTAERIIDAAPCDLLILKPENFKLRLGRSRREQIILPTN